MGQCTSKNEQAKQANGVYNQMEKSDRQLRSFIGYSTTINDVYTPSVASGVEQTVCLADPAEPLIPK